MKKIKGPAIFLAQFVGEEAPFNSLDNICKWASSLGYKGVQIPSWDSRLIDLQKASESKDYCDEIKGIVNSNNIEITELSTHLQGQLVAVHPAYDIAFDGFAAAEVKGNPKARQEWAVKQVMMAAQASNNLGLDRHATFSGALAWPYFYPWPQRPQGLVENAFDELAKRWKPILDRFDENGVDLCYERCNMLYDPSHYILQHLDYLAHIDIYHEKIKMFHVKDAELNPTGKQGVYGGYQSWINRAGRFRSLGDGQVNFKSIFSKLTSFGYDGWAVLEWECCLKHPEDGAREGAEFIKNHIINTTDKAFDDFAGSDADIESNKKMLGL
jgi:sugar phosphate isomerase/epimerase